MAAGGETGDVGAMIYCVVPRDLAERMYETLREHFRGTGVQVVVERREADRRIGGMRRRAEPLAPRGAERRRVRSVTGRRVAERRALTAPTHGVPQLPRKARRYEQRLVFLERLEPSAEQLRDADSKRLVTRYQAGDKAVFGELYLRYFNDMYSYARVALADHHEAEDVTQQVFERALGALGRFELRPNVPFRSWLFSITRNIVLTTVKHRQGLQPEEPAHLEAMRENDCETEAALATLGWLTDREVAMFVERLPLIQRQALVLRFMFDLPSHEIGRILGRSPVSIRKLQSRALKSLEVRLAAAGRTPPRGRPTAVRRRLRPLPVMAERRFALTFTQGTS